jgi:hypothetical protein
MIVHPSVDDRLDHDMIVFQSRAFRRPITRSLVLDHVEFGEPIEVLTDCAFVAVELPGEIAHRVDSRAMLVEVLEEFEPAVGEEIAAGLTPHHE